MLSNGRGLSRVGAGVSVSISSQVWGLRLAPSLSAMARTIYQARDMRTAKDGRQFYIDHKNKTVIITSPRHEGTAFRPQDWGEYLKAGVPNK